MTVKVKALNNYNKPFGIEKGNVYEAIKVETKITVESASKNYNDHIFTAVSYTINGLNHPADDFEEIK